MKKIKYLLLGIVGILGLGFSSASFSVSGVIYEDGIYRSQDKGLITVITGTNIATLQDKNLGATVLYNGTLTEKSNYIQFSMSNGSEVISSDCSMIGNLYQFGNNYGFDCSLVASGYYDNSIVDLTTSIVYTDNYSSSSLFYNRDGYDISNAWGGLTATPVAQQGPCPNGFYVPNSTDFQNFSNMLSQFDFLTRDTRDYPKGNAVAYFLKLPTVGRNGSWTNAISRIPLLNSNGDFKYLLAADFNRTLNKVYFGLNNSFYVRVGSNYYSPPYVDLSPVRCFKNTPLLPNNSWVTLTGGDTSVLPEPDPDNGSGSNIIDISYSGNSNLSLYYSCLGPTYNTPDGLPPFYCFDSSGNLNPDIVKNCFFTVDTYSGDLVSPYYCYIDGFQQQVDIVPDGSGVSFVPCSGSSCDINYLYSLNLSGEISYDQFIDYYNTFFTDRTKFWFNCPFEIDSTLSVWPRLSNLLQNKANLTKPIGCFISAFSNGYGVSFFGDFGENNPYWSGYLLNSNNEAGSGFIYSFLDLLLSLGLFVLIGKIFKLF